MMGHVTLALMIQNLFLSPNAESQIQTVIKEDLGSDKSNRSRSNNDLPFWLLTDQTGSISILDLCSFTGDDTSISDLRYLPSSWYYVSSMASYGDLQKMERASDHFVKMNTYESSSTLQHQTSMLNHILAFSAQLENHNP